MCEANSFYAAFLNKVIEGKGDVTPIIDNRKSCTFTQLIKAIDQLTDELTEKGVKKGDHVALWGCNSIEWLSMFLAITRIGAVAVLFNYSLSQAELEAFCDLCDIKAIAYGVTRALKEDPQAPFNLAAAAGINPDMCLRFDDGTLLERSASRTVNTDFTDITEEESRNSVAFIVFTTGTTSQAKAVQLTQWALLHDSKNWINVEGRVRAEDYPPTLVAIPLFHIFGLLTVVIGILNDLLVLLIAQFTPEEILAIAKGRNVDTLTTVAAVHLKLIEHPDFKDILSHPVRRIVSGGGALTQTQFLRIETAYDDARVANGYGQTEATGVVTLPPNTASFELRSTTVGKAYPGKTVVILNPQNQVLKTGEIGEVAIKDEGTVMKGYMKLPPEAQPIDKDGYLHTGDLGYFDQDGYLHLTGRIKDIIIKGGENISPLEVEKALTDLDTIREAKVFGAPHPIYGENVQACVTCFDNASFDEDKIKAEIKKSLAPFKVPERIFLFDQFPVNENGKLDQRTLSVQMLDLLNRYYIDEYLKKGALVADMVIKNSCYTIMPLVSFVVDTAQAVGFSAKKIVKIRLATEEFLTERIINAYTDVGDIRVKILFYPDMMAVQFSDGGQEYDIHKDEKTNISARLILNSVDSFSIEKNADAKSEYRLSFLYENPIDIQEFLLEQAKLVNRK